MLRKVLFAALTVSLLAAPAAAQVPMGIHMGRTKKTLTPEEREKQRKIDEAYQAATKKIPEKQAADPWASVRPNPGAPKN